jgi:nucleotide-binding universal stress UspA family protein
MIVRLRYVWERIRSSLWFVPAWMSVAAAALALVSGQLDEALASTGATPWFVYGGDRDGARALLSTVAGSRITVAGVTFSVTVVALSLASSQFGPRLLLNFMRDRGNQLVLGTFIATFVFCLLVVLIYFIHHVSSSIRAEQVIDVVARDLQQADISGADEERMARARATLQQFTRRCSASAPCETTVTLGRPADAIAAVADHRHAGLIVMALAGSGHWLGARPGSIAYGVPSLATAPVLVVLSESSALAFRREA